MINFTTNKEYQGSNIEELYNAELDDTDLDELVKQDRDYENAWAKNVKKNGLEI